MKTKLFVLLVTIILMVCVSVYARGQDGKGLDDPQKTGNYDKSQHQNIRTIRNETKNDKQIKTEQLRIREMLQKQVIECTRTANELKSATGTQTRDQIQKLNQIKEKISLMNQLNKKFEQTLSETEKKQVQKHLKKLEKLQTQIQKQSKECDQELAKENPSQKEVRNRFKEMEKTATKIESQYRAMEWILTKE